MIVVQFTRDDLNVIKSIEDLFVSADTSFLSFSSSLIADMNSNPVVAVSGSEALRISSFVNDTTRPQILGFDLDMNRGILSVYFLETVNVLSVNYTCFTLQNDFFGSTAFSLTGGSLLLPLRPGEVRFSSSGSGAPDVTGFGSGSAAFSGSGNATENGETVSNIFNPEIGSSQLFDQFVVLTDLEAQRDATAIFINVTLNDLNAIKALRIAEAEASSWLDVQSCAILDQNNLQVQPVTSGVNALNVRFYAEDVTSPVLLEFDLNMNSGLLVFRFSETVSGSFLNAAQLTLQASSNSNLSPDLMHTLAFNVYTPGVHSTAALAPELSLQIQILDLNELKRLLRVATSSEDTYISISAEFIADTKGNALVPIPYNDGLQVSEYVQDSTPPELVRFDLDLDSDILTLTFDETVSGSTLDETAITLQESRSLLDFEQFYTLVGSPHDRLESTVINIYLSFEDRNEIKRLQELAIRRRNTWIVFTEALVNDTNGNPVVEIINGSVQQVPNVVSGFTVDTTQPELLNFTLNLTSEILSLSFSETVNSSSIDLTQIVLQNSDMNADRSHTLTGGEVLDGNSAFVDIKLSLGDLNTIKQFRDLAMDFNNTFISISRDFISDMNSNAITEITTMNAQQASVFFEDLTSPELIAFDLDLTAEILILYFSETVDPTTLIIDNITLQEVVSLDANSTSETYSLTDAIVSTQFSAEVSIELTQFDLNNIKLLFNLATFENDTYVSFPETLIQDMNFNYVEAVSPVSAQRVRQYTADTTPPVLLDFSLDINLELLVLNFSEVVNVNSFNLSEVFIQGMMFQPLPSTRLTQGSVSMLNDTVIEVRLLRLDLNNLKRNTGIAVSASTTFIAFEAPIVYDMAANPITLVPKRNAQPVRFYSPDTVSPVLEAFDLNVNDGTFTLYFNETVNTSSLTLTAITFLASTAGISSSGSSVSGFSDSLVPLESSGMGVSGFASSGSGVSMLEPLSRYLTLEGGQILTLTDQPVLMVRFTTDDLNTLKLRNLCRSPFDCYISFLSETVFDTAGNAIVPIPEDNALLVSDFTFDTTNPSLVRFLQLDLNNGTILLEFDETVNIDTFNFSAITLQSFFRNPQASLTLSGGYSPSQSGTIVMVFLMTGDLILLQEDDRVCSNINNCWITITMDSIFDLNSNGLNAVQDGAGLDVREFIDDVIPPSLSSFTLDMDDGVLTLVFSEPVRSSSLDPSGIFILPEPNATEYIQLTDATTPSLNGREVIVILSEDDVTLIRATEFAKSIEDTFLNIDSNAITDVTVRMPNQVVPIPNAEAIQALEYTEDTTQPFLVDFTLDLALEILTLTFSEPVRTSVLDSTQIAIVSSQLQTAEVVTLTGGIVTSETAFDGTLVVSIIINRPDNEAIKLNSLLASSGGNTFLTLSGATLTDMAGNFEVEIPADFAMPVLQLTQDDTEAILESFVLDIDNGELALSFTDVVVPSTLRAASITIQDEASAATTVQLSDTSYTMTVEGYTVLIQISISDLNAIKFDTSLATSINDTFITVAADVVRDLTSSDVIPITNGNGLQASDYVSDTTAPLLESFELDLNLGQLQLDFSETVNVDSLDVSGIVLQNSPSANLVGTTYLRLSQFPPFPVGSEAMAFSENSSSVVISLGSQDLNELKRLADLGTLPTNTFISIDNTTIVDMVGFENEALEPENAIPANVVFSDQTRPELVSYDIDITEGRLYLTFSETVNTNTLNVNGIIVQNTSEGYVPMVRVNLRSSVGTTTVSSNGVVVAVDIGRDDLNDIKRFRTLATSDLDTFLFLRDVIEDMSGNLNVHIYNPFARQVTGFTEDSRDPFLFSFDLDLNRGELILTFDETVETSSLQVGGIVVQSVSNILGDFLPFSSASGSTSLDSSASPGSASGMGIEFDDIEVESRRLVAGQPLLFTLTFSADDPVIVVSLGELDLNEIKRLRDLGTSVNNTFISFSAATIQDMNDNFVTPISNFMAIMATNVVLDISLPILRSYDLDMDSGIITLTFDETINAMSVDPTSIVLQNALEPNNFHRLSGGSVLSNDSTVIAIQATASDLNVIKEDIAFATGVENTYLRILENGVFDMSNNGIQEISPSNALRVSTFTEDTSSPELLSFNLNLDTPELTLVFDETVNTSSLNVQGLSLQQYNDSLGEFIILSPPTGTSDPNSTIFVVRLSPEDANEIKQLTSLAIDSTSTFLAIQNFTIADMNGNSVSEISISDALPVTEYTIDQSAPILEEFHLDLDSNQLVLTFDETVNVNTLDAQLITIHSSSEIMASAFVQPLTGGSVINNNNRIVYLQLILSDANNIKLYPAFGTNINNTYLTISDNAIIDLSFLNPNGLLATTLQSSAVVADETTPRLRMFTVDLNAGRLTLYFNEPVNASTFTASGLTVQSARRSRTGLRLTNSLTPSSSGLSIVVTLSPEDLNEIKRIDTLLVDVETSYITITDLFIEDMNGNSIVPVINGFALQASGFIPDMSRPFVSSYSLDMDSGYVAITFSETVNVSSISCDQLTFAASETCAVNYTLTDCVIDATNATFDSVDVGTSGSGSGDYGSAPDYLTPFHYSTTVMFSFTLGDLNQLKTLDIARSVDTTFLSYTSELLFDQNDLPINERNCSTMGRPIDASMYTPDTTPPQLASFNLSINEGKLVLSFTETVRTARLQVNQITLQNDISNSTQFHMLGLDNSTRTFDGPTDIVTIYIAPGDLNQLKFLDDLAISNDTTFLSATAQAIVDTKGNYLVPVDALPVAVFEADMTPPVLVSFDLNVNEGLLLLTFDETVNFDTLNVTGFTIQAVPDLSVFGFNTTDTNATNSTVSGSGEIFDLTPYEDCSTLLFELTGGYIRSPENSTELILALTLDDLNDIKRELCLASSAESTFLSFQQDTVLDMNDNGIETVEQSQAIAVTSFMEDITRPNLVDFDLNLTSEALTLYFDETVNATSFDSTQLTLFSRPVELVNFTVSIDTNLTAFDNTTNANVTQFEALTVETNYTLISGQLLSGDDPILTLQLSQDDLNNIKAITDLATEAGNTYLAISDRTVLDMNTNNVNELTTLGALPVRIFTEDEIRPTLLSFDLDLDLEVLVLTFDETVNVSSLNLSRVTLLSDNSSQPFEFWSLNGGSSMNYSSSSSPNQPVITIDLGYIDINEIKRLSLLAISNDTSFLSISAGAILDINDNPVVEIGFEDALEVGEYTDDVTAPRVVRFDLDMNTGLLTLEFDETVNASSLNISELIVQSNGNSLSTYLAIYNSSVELIDDVFVFVQFGFDFLNELKRVDDLATNASDTFLSLPSSAIVDMNGNEVVAIPENSARPVTVFTQDTNPPTLQSFDLDMNLGILTLYFNETIRVSTINTTVITLAQFQSTLAPNVSGFGSLDGLATTAFMSGSGSAIASEFVGQDVDFYVLTGGFIQESNSHVVTINFTLFDLNQVKLLRNLATSIENTFILLTLEALEDMRGNPVVAIDEGDGLQVSSFTEDTTPPDVTEYHLDMNTGQLTISFTESVDVRTLLIAERVTFYNTSDLDGEMYSLIDSTSDSVDGTVVEINLSPLDINQLKFIRNLASSQVDTFLFLNNTISDMVGNPITLLYMGTNETRPANNFTADVTPPILLQYDVDLDSGILYLTFSEVVDEIDIQNFAFQNDQNETNTTEVYTLTGYQRIFGPSLLPLGPGFPPKLTIELTAVDLNAIKSLLELATSNDNTFLTISSLAAVDAFNNSIAEITEFDALRVSAYIPDTTSPQLVSFDFSVDTGLLSLTFDESVSVGSFNVTELSFVNINTGTEYTLEDQPPNGDATLSEDDSIFVELLLSNADLNEIKVLTDLSTSENDTYILFEETTILDTSDNVLNISNLPLPVRTFTEDATRPELRAFVLDLNDDTLVLSFSETVNVSSLDISEITLQPFANATNFSYTLMPSFEFPEGTVTTTTNRPIIVLDLGTADLNEIKRIPQLATEFSNTFISVTVDTVVDMNGLPLVAIEPNAALQVQQYVPDTTNPVLIGFDFDLDSGLLTLTFNETVNIGSINPPSVSFQDSIRSVFHTLMMGNAVGINDPVVFFPLTIYDLNQVKLIRPLATSENNTYLSLVLGAIEDMAGNPSDPTLQQVVTFTDDTTRPNLTNFVIDINASLLILNFDEPVDRSTLNIQRITLQSSQNRSSDPFLYYDLQAGTSNSTDGLAIRISIDNDDLNEIKRRPGLLVSEETSFISITEDFISDMRGNPIEAISQADAQMTVNFITDSQRPSILEFHLDMDASLLHLTFFETVNASSINFTSFVIQADSDVQDEQMQYRLTGGDLLSYNDSTVVSIVITLEDLNAIKIRQIATSTLSSWLVAEATGIMDQNDLALIPLVNGENAQQASQYTIDTTRPEMEAFSLDLNNGRLTLYFSETVSAASLNATTITLQNAQFSSGLPYMYTVSELGSILSTDGPVISIELATFDLNEIKRRPDLGTAIEDTYISVRSSTVFDTQMNFLIPIANGGALQASSVEPDITAPTLLEFSLDMDSANLTLTFDEAVNATSFDSTGITFFSPNTSVAMYTLTGGFVIDCFGTVVTMNINDRDFDLLKVNTQLCSEFLQGDCMLLLAQGSILDMSGNGNNATELLPTNVVPDTTNPYLVYYDLDLTAEELRLTFSEIVQTSQLTTQEITLLAAPFEFDARSNQSRGINLDINDPETFTGSLRAYTLSGGILSGPNQVPDHPPLLVISLTQKDLDILKSLEAVGTSPDNTYLLISSNSARDYYNNDLVAIENSNGRQVRVYTSDQLRPSLLSFEFDLDSGELSLSFSETVDRSSLQPNGISLQGSTNSSMSDIYTLSGGVSTSYDNPVIFLTLSQADLNEVKRHTLIATEESTTHLSLSEVTISDQNRNRVFAIEESLAQSVLQPGGFIPDTTEPRLLQFSLDLNTGQILLTFDETINSSSFVIEALTLSDNTTTFAVNQTLSEGTLLTNDSTTLSYLLNDDNLNEIKRTQLCTAAGNGNDCYLFFTNDTVLDMSDNELVPRGDGNAIQVDPYVMDVTSPEIVYFSVNMSLGNVTLSFSETVNVSTFVSTGITLHEFGDPALSTISYQLTGGTQLTTENGLSVDFYFNMADLESLRSNDQIFVSQITSYISASPNTIRDMSGNPLAQLDYKISDDYAADTIGPRVVGSSLDLNDGTLELTFSETIRSISFRPDQITLLSSSNASSNASTAYTLTNGAFNSGASFDGTVISIALDPADLLEIQANEGLATSRNTSFIIYTETIAVDLANNEAELVPPLQVGAFTSDGVDPNIFSFLELDLTLRQLVVEFNEPVDLANANASLFTLQEFPNNTIAASAGVNITLTGGTFSYRDAEANQKRVVVLSFNVEDYRTIVLERRIATSVFTSYISLPVGAVFDFAGNPLVDIPPSDGRQVEALIPDLTIPEILQYDLDLDLGRFTVYFDNVMNSSTLDARAITIQDAATGSVPYTLTGGRTSSSPDYSIVIEMSMQDLNEVKRLTAIATEVNNTFITVTANLLDSVGGVLTPRVGGAGIDLLAITDNNGLQVRNFTPDTTDPFLASFDVSIDVGEIRLTFDETVNASSLDLEAITLQNAAGNTTRNFSLTVRGIEEGLETVSTQEDSTVITISLGFQDLNDIKRYTDLAVNNQTTFITFGNTTVSDMNGNSVVAIASDNAGQVSQFTPDSTPPTLEGFSLDLNTGELVLTFDEIVNVDSLMTTGITFQNMSFLGDTYSLSPLSFSASDNEFLVSVNISIPDLNELKRHRQLATGITDTFISLSRSSIQDINGNSVNEISIIEAIPVSGYESDSTPPNLVSFHLNLNSAILYLTFDETVDINSLTFRDITFLSGANTSIASSYTLTGGVRLTGDTHEPSVFLIPADQFAIKLQTDLATSLSDTYIQIEPATIFDTALNPVNPILDPLPAENYTADTTPPVLRMFSVDLDAGLLLLMFDEPVNASSLNFENFILQSGTVGTFSMYPLTGGLTNSSDGRYVCACLYV